GLPLVPQLVRRNASRGDATVAPGRGEPGAVTAPRRRGRGRERERRGNRGRVRKRSATCGTANGREEALIVNRADNGYSTQQKGTNMFEVIISILHTGRVERKLFDTRQEADRYVEKRLAWARPLCSSVRRYRVEVVPRPIPPASFLSRPEISA